MYKVTFSWKNQACYLMNLFPEKHPVKYLSNMDVFTRLSINMMIQLKDLRAHLITKGYTQTYGLNYF